MSNRFLLSAVLATIVSTQIHATDASQDKVCLKCHLSRLGDSVSLKAPQIDSSSFYASVHGELPCQKCHVIDPTKKHEVSKARPCGTCHKEESHSFDASPHAHARLQFVTGSPTCVSCHGYHNTLATKDPLSATNRLQAYKVCIGCHEDDSLAARFEQMPQPARIKAYERSVHGRAFIAKGDDTAPTCIDCHGSHNFLPSDDPSSPVYKQHIASTCGKCHRQIAEHYSASVHGVSLEKGIVESPTCTDCHGEHGIQAHADPESKVFVSNVSKTCSECHTSEKIVAKYGLKPDRIATFKESFHGAASQLGDTRVANCASCHGVHDIFPQSDTRSLINPANIETTCGSCHEGLPADFAKGAVHTSASSRDSGGEFYVRMFYVWFISILILLFIGYRILEYRRRIRRVD